MQFQTRILALLIACHGGVALAANPAFPEQPSEQIGAQYEQRAEFASVAGQDGTIPPVVERNPDPQAGPRIWVNRFKLDAMPEFPERDITRESVGRLVEQLRYDSMKLSSHIAYGYSRQDLVDIAQIISEIEGRGIFAEVTPLDVETLMDIISEQRLKRGLTHGQLEEIAQAVTRMYRERGYFLARAYIPAQEVTGGEVELRVLEGRLGNVAVQGEHRYRDSLLTDAFLPLVGETVTAENVQEAMYLSNDLPGVSLFGYFTAGEQVGETQLNLTVRNEKRWDALLRLDNHGSDLTGEYRAFAQFQLLNPTGAGDRLQLGVLQTGEPANSTYGMLDYEVPVFGLRDRIGVMGSYNDYVVGGTGSLDDIAGESVTGELSWTHAFLRGRKRNFSTGLLFAEKRSDLAGIGGTFQKVERSQNAGLGLDWDSLFEQSRVLARAGARLESGSVQEGLEDGQEDAFGKLYADGSVLFFVPLPFSDRDSRMVVNTVLQWSDVKMPSVELYSLGGPNGVKGFAPTAFSADRAGYLGAEWFLPMPKFLDFGLAGNRSLADVLQFTLFADGGYGTQVALEPSVGVPPADQWGWLASAGVGARVAWGGRFGAQLTVAQPLGKGFSDPDVDAGTEEELRAWLDMTYQFN